MDTLRVVLSDQAHNQPTIMLGEERNFDNNSLNVDMHFLRSDSGPRSPKKLPKIKSPSKSPLRSGNWQVSVMNLIYDSLLVLSLMRHDI